MTSDTGFNRALESKVREQLASQRVGYLLGAGASYLDGHGYPLTSELWSNIKQYIEDPSRRDEIQGKLDEGANGIEHALDLLDDGGPAEGPHRHLVAAAIARFFAPITPPLDEHAHFLTQLSRKGDRPVRIFNLNYDPIIERAAEKAGVRVSDGFVGHEQAFFEPAVFNERIGVIRGTHRARKFDETVTPIHLVKLHGSLGWHESETTGVRRSPFTVDLSHVDKRLMVPPQRRKANDTMLKPYSHLWSTFRGALSQDTTPLNRLVCLGYGLGDEHVNAAIENALARPDFTLLVFSRSLGDDVWARWSKKANVILVTETRSSLKGTQGPGHSDLWSFEQVLQEL